MTLKSVLFAIFFIIASVSRTSVYSFVAFYVYPCSFVFFHTFLISIISVAMVFSQHDLNYCA